LSEKKRPGVNYVIGMNGGKYSDPDSSSVASRSGVVSNLSEAGK